MQADKYQDDINEAFNKIMKTTEPKNKILNLNNEYFRFKVNHHFIYYTKTQNSINVSRILHEKMDFERHLKLG